EDPVALLVDDLLGLDDRVGDRLLAARMRLGADETVFFHFAANLLLDEAGGLVLPEPRERGRADAIAVIFDRVLLGRRGSAATEEAGKKGSEHRRLPYPRYAPPLTCRTCPVVKHASSDARNTAVRAISSGCAMRPRGIV